MNVLEQFNVKPVYVLNIRRDYEDEKDFDVEIFLTETKAKLRMKEIYEEEKAYMFPEIRIEDGYDDYMSINDNYNFFTLYIKEVKPK